MMSEQSQTVQVIRMDSIHVLNPRVRNKKSFHELVESIKAVGLKRPITVTKQLRESEGTDYDLVCGQGRLEAFGVLHETFIPAFVIVADIHEAMVKSLVENCARRQHSANDLLRDIGRLKSSNYTDVEISRKTGLSAEYVRGVTRLMARGEERLLRAVESGQLPLTVAVEISSAEDSMVQDALQQAYERKDLRGRKLLIVKKLIENRRVRGKGIGGSGSRRKSTVTPEALLRAYQEDTDRKRLLIRKADAVRNKLFFITHAVRQLLKDDAFHEILTIEGLSTIPRNLATRISKGEVA